MRSVYLIREHPRTYKDDVANFSSSTSISDVKSKMYYIPILHFVFFTL
nr:palindromic element RPE5 domain-containing protein [Rickettsia bellii]